MKQRFIAMDYKTRASVAELIVRSLDDRGIKPDETFVAAAGSDYGSVQRYELMFGLHAIAYGDNASTEYELTDMPYDDSDSLATWLIHPDLDEYDGTIERAMVLGIDSIEAADPDCDGECRVLITQYWYKPAETTAWANDGGDTLEFASAKEAQEWIDQEDEGIYRLSHNESSRPTYTIVSFA